MPDLTQWTLDAALRSVLLCLLAAWATWWVVGLLVAVVDPRAAARFGPPLLRALLVGGVLAATTLPAQASQDTPTGALDGLPLPQRPLTETPAPPVAPRAVTRGVHVVRPGDTLWAIARSRDPDATDAGIAAAVARWHAVNRGVIGPDPDLIRPGQRLVPPGAP